MHQNLLDRPDLPAGQARRPRSFELAQDFHRAGLLDRAEELFTKLDGTHVRACSRWAPCCRSTSRRRTGRRRSPPPSGWKRWPSSRTSRRSPTTTASWRRRAAALATRRRAARCIDQALAEYKLLHARDDAAGRPRGAAGQRCARRSPPGSASSRRIPRFSALVADRLADAYRRTGDVAQGIRVLRNYQDQYPSLDLLNALFNADPGARRAGGGDAADQGRARAQSDAARTRQAARSAAAGSAGGAPPRSRAGQERWSASTSSGSACIAATTAAFAPSSTTGAARAAANGKRIRRDAPKRRTVSPDDACRRAQSRND